MILTFIRFYTADVPVSTGPSRKIDSTTVFSRMQIIQADVNCAAPVLCGPLLGVGFFVVSRVATIINDPLPRTDGPSGIEASAPWISGFPVRSVQPTWHNSNSRRRNATNVSLLSHYRHRGARSSRNYRRVAAGIRRRRPGVIENRAVSSALSSQSTHWHGDKDIKRNGRP